MKQSDDWAERLAAVIAGEVRRYRLNRKMSTQRLSDRCGELGMDIPRAVISNLENGRRTSVAVAELLVLAAALGIPPAALIFPVGRAETTEALPEAEVPPFEAVRWLGGEEYATTPGADTTEQATSFRDLRWPTMRTPGEAIHLYRDLDRKATEGLEHADRAARMRHDAYNLDAGPARDALLQAAEHADLSAREELTSLMHMLAAMRADGILPPNSGHLSHFLNATRHIKPKEAE